MKSEEEGLITLACFSLAMHVESLEETRTRVQSLVPQLATQIVERVASLCMQSLEAAHAIPRLYRRTNREVGDDYSIQPVQTPFAYRSPVLFLPITCIE